MSGPVRAMSAPSSPLPLEQSNDTENPRLVVERVESADTATAQNHRRFSTGGVHSYAEWDPTWESFQPVIAVATNTPTQTQTQTPTQAHPVGRTGTPPPHQQSVHHLATLKSTATALASSYLHFGILYHGLPFKLRFDPRIHSTIRKYAREHFNVSNTRELPPLITLFGSLEHSFAQVSARLDDGKADETHALLTLAERLVAEAHQTVVQLRQAMEVYLRLKHIKILEGRWDGPDARRPRDLRENMKDLWIEALPAICWEGFIAW